MDPKAVKPAPTSGPRRKFLIISFAICCLFAFILGTITTSKPRDIAPPLVVENTSLSFGEVWENARFNWPFDILNASPHDIDIEDFATSCGCVGVNPDSIRISPGEKTSINLTLDLQDKTNLDTPSSVRDFSVQIIPRPRRPIDSGRPISWIVTGRVRSAIRLSSPSIDFGEELTLGCTPPSRSLRITSFVPLCAIDVNLSEPLAEVQLVENPTSHRAFTLKMKPSASLPVGPFAFHITLIACLESGLKLPPLIVPVTGTILREIQALPSALHLGPHLVGTECIENLLRFSPVKESLDLQAIHFDSTFGIHIEREAKRTDNGLAFRVHQRIISAGAHEADVRFYFARKDSEALIIPVRISYYGYPHSVCNISRPRAWTQESWSLQKPDGE